MNPFSFVFQQVLYRPLFNLLVLIYEYVPPYDFGISILLLTFLIRMALWPLNSKAIISQRETQIKAQKMQEKMKEIMRKYREDPMRQNQEIGRLWKENKFNPFSGFVPMAIQIIILIALYQVFRTIVQPEQFGFLYSFVPRPDVINPTLFGLIDLSKPSWVLAILTGISQYFYSKTSFLPQKKTKVKKRDPKKDQMQKMQKIMQEQMTYFMPLIITFISLGFPGALPLYWCFSNIIGIVQQKMIYKKYPEAR
ncbi:membrane protein insertase YidC [bacterium]|nr:membrane protein insertase YidC [bacterium]